MMMTTTTTTTTTTTMIRRFFYCYHQALHESKNTSLCGVRTETAPGWRGLSNNNNDIILYKTNGFCLPQGTASFFYPGDAGQGLSEAAASQPLHAKHHIPPTTTTTSLSSPDSYFALLWFRGCRSCAPTICRGASTGGTGAVAPPG